MKKIVKIIVIIIPLLFILQNANSQTLSISETLDYINEKFENNKESLDMHAKIVWEVSSDGKLTITRYWFNKFSSVTTVYLNELDENYVLIAPHSPYPNGQPRNNFIQVYTKNDKNAINYKSDGFNNNSSFFTIIFKDDPAVAKQLKNAIIHLIKKAKENKTYKKNDPFDN